MTKINRLVYFIIPLTFCCNKTFRLKNYYKPFDTQTIIYKVTIDSSYKTITYFDTITCNMIVRSGTNLCNKEYYKKDLNFFYFTGTKKRDTLRQDIFSYDFNYSDLTFAFDKENLYVSDFVLRKNNPLDDYFSLLIPKKIRPYQKFLHKSGDYRKSYTLIGQDSLKVQNRSFKCLQFSSTFIDRKRKEHIDTFWISNYVGLVKYKSESKLIEVVN